MKKKKKECSVSKFYFCCLTLSMLGPWEHEKLLFYWLRDEDPEKEHNLSKFTQPC